MGNFVHSKTVSKHKIQLLLRKVWVILYLLKEKVANTSTLKIFSQNIIEIKKKFLKIF